MQIDYVQFYVWDALRVRDWFLGPLNFRSIGTQITPHTHTEIVSSGTICFMVSSPRSALSPVYEFLQVHPPGVVDIAFRVRDLEGLMQSIAQAEDEFDQALILQPMQQWVQRESQVRWATIQAWGTVRHTVLERSGETTLLPLFDRSGVPLSDRSLEDEPIAQNEPIFQQIDHIVLNVEAGELEAAIRWYERVFGFRAQQRFEIETEYSGLCSRVMRHPESGIRLPINEPSSPTSQVQEFLDLNRGAGVQHIALHTLGLVRAIEPLRDRGVAFLDVPPSYYQQIRERQDRGLDDAALAAIEAAEILVDWQRDRPQAVLLQTFTQPIFEQPTFFFELIERQQYCVNEQWQRAEGFGEGNFQALFEAIEREQRKRERRKQGAIESL